MRRPLRPALGFLLLFAAAAPTATGQFLTPPHDLSNSIQCTTCHDLHQDPLYDYHTIPGTINLCKSCHNASGIGDINTHSPFGVDMKCTDCHNPHRQDQQITYGSSFSQLIRTTVPTPNNGPRPVILMRPTGANSFADGDGFYDGICEVCHTTTKYHRNDPSGDHTHYVGQDCRTCHDHLYGHAPGGCTDCHDQLQPPTSGYRRQVVQNNGDGLGDFVRLSHHVSDGTTTELVNDGDCNVCHDLLLHQTMSDPTVLLKDADGGPSHTFDGTDASLEAFCRSCHDADGRAGRATPPFSDGQLPTDIEAWWSLNPSHASAPLGVSCWTCHQNGHGADNPSLTLALEESGCLNCHDGSVTAVDLLADFGQPYNHPLGAASLAHAAGEDPLTMPRHVECVDCHNPHAANDQNPGVPPQVSGLLAGVPGVDTDGLPLPTATNGYEVCYRCHADTTPAAPALPRTLAESNVRTEFDAGQPSFHPIEAAGRNPDVPSLSNGWTTTSVMTCWDCHAGAARGPHGSNEPWILADTYAVGDPQAESDQAYALCYSCHDRDSIRADESFPEHDRHIRGDDTACSVCHDAHAAAAHAANPSGTHLINFRTDVVSPNSQGQLWFRDDGRLRGACALQCHGEDHDPYSY